MNIYGATVLTAMPDNPYFLQYLWVSVNQMGKLATHINDVLSKTVSLHMGISSTCPYSVTPSHTHALFCTAVDVLLCARRTATGCIAKGLLKVEEQMAKYFFLSFTHVGEKGRLEKSKIKSSY